MSLYVYLRMCVFIWMNEWWMCKSSTWEVRLSAFILFTSALESTNLIKATTFTALRCSLSRDVITIPSSMREFPISFWNQWPQVILDRCSSSASTNKNPSNTIMLCSTNYRYQMKIVWWYLWIHLSNLNLHTCMYTCCYTRVRNPYTHTTLTNLCYLNKTRIVWKRST